MERVFPYFLLGFLLVIPGGVGLYSLVMNTKPCLPQRWLFYILIFMIVCGLTLPVFAMLNRYFFSSKHISAKAVTREGCSCGAIADILIWFRIGRVLSTVIIFILIGGFVLVEILLRARENVEFRSGIDDVEE